MRMIVTTMAVAMRLRGALAGRRRENFQARKEGGDQQHQNHTRFQNSAHRFAPRVSAKGLPTRPSIVAIAV